MIGVRIALRHSRNPQYSYNDSNDWIFCDCRGCYCDCNDCRECKECLTGDQGCGSSDCKMDGDGGILMIVFVVFILIVAAIIIISAVWVVVGYGIKRMANLHD
eukprot:PhF_6_TR43351/c0_g1_i2/m.66404